MFPKIAFLDYQVIDYILRVAIGKYSGVFAGALKLLEYGAATGKYQFWMSEISKVEMIIGLENPLIERSQVSTLIQKDENKINITKNLGVKWLGYPCSKLDDQYSRLGVSFRVSGPEWSIASAFEAKIERVLGVSAGDARQIVSLVLGFDDENTPFH